MMIGGSTALVTGANRGLGKALVRALLEAGCAKVYAGARNIEGVAPDRVVQPLQLDITNMDQVAAAAARCGDVDILINNAGVAGFTPVLAAPTMDNARLEIETNYLGTLAMCRAFAPALERNGGESTYTAFNPYPPEFLQGALRNPSAADGQFGRLIFGFAVTEALGIFSLLIALILLFT